MDFQLYFPVTMHHLIFLFHLPPSTKYIRAVLYPNLQSSLQTKKKANNFGSLQLIVFLLFPFAWQLGLKLLVYSSANSCDLQELAHRQQFYFWKNYRNNRLKHILPRPLPEPPALHSSSAPSQQSVPSLPSVAATSVPVTAAPAPTPSSIQFVNPPGSSLAKSETRSSGIDRRKRKYGYFLANFMRLWSLFYMIIIYTSYSLAVANQTIIGC